MNEYIAMGSLTALDSWISRLNRQASGSFRPGYKAERVTFGGGPTETQTTRDSRLQIGEAMIRQSSAIDFSQGDIIASDRRTHLAIAGEGWFPIATSLAAGSTVYFTRNGEFHLDVNGRYRTAEGYYLLSADDLEPGSNIVRTTASGPPNNLTAGAVGVTEITVNGTGSYGITQSVVGAASGTLTKTATGNGVIRDDFTDGTVNTAIWQAPPAHVTESGGQLHINGGTFSSVAQGGGDYGAFEWRWRDATYNVDIGTGQRYFWASSAPWIDFGREGLNNYYAGMSSAAPTFTYGNWWGDGNFHTARMERVGNTVTFSVDGVVIKTGTGSPGTATFSWASMASMNIDVDYFTFQRNVPITFTGLPPNGSVEILTAGGAPTGIMATADAAGNASVDPKQLTFQFPGSFRFRILNSASVEMANLLTAGVNGGDAYNFAYNATPVTVTNVPAGVFAQIIDASQNVVATSTTSGPGSVTIPAMVGVPGGRIRLVDAGGTPIGGAASAIGTVNPGDVYDVSQRRGLQPALFVSEGEFLDTAHLGQHVFTSTQVANLQPWKTNGAGRLVRAALEGANVTLPQLAPELALAQRTYDGLAKILAMRKSSFDQLAALIR
jgi:flagellar hook-basal body protein